MDSKLNYLIVAENQTKFKKGEERMNIEILIIGGGGLMVVIITLVCLIYAIIRHNPRGFMLKAAAVFIIAVCGVIIVWDLGPRILKDAKIIPKSLQYYPILPK